MRPIFKPDTHTEAALYWSAVSLMVCEGLPLEEAAHQLGIEGEDLRSILQRRATHFPCDDLKPAEPLRTADTPAAEYC